MKNLRIFSVAVVALAFLFSACNKDVPDQIADEDATGTNIKGYVAPLDKTVGFGDMGPFEFGTYEGISNNNFSKLGGTTIQNVNKLPFGDLATDGFTITGKKDQDIVIKFADNAAKLGDEYSVAVKYTANQGVSVAFSFNADACAGQEFSLSYNGNTEFALIKVAGFSWREEVVVHLGFIGYYCFEGNVLSTSPYWQDIKKGEKIDWKAVDAAYADWVKKGGLAPGTTYQTSGAGSYTFEYGDPIGFDDFNEGQLEGYYKAYYVDPGYLGGCGSGDDDGDDDNDDSILIYFYISDEDTAPSIPLSFPKNYGNTFYSWVQSSQELNAFLQKEVPECNWYAGWQYRDLDNGDIDQGRQPKQNDELVLQEQYVDYGKAYDFCQSYSNLDEECYLYVKYSDLNNILLTSDYKAAECAWGHILAEFEKEEKCEE